MKVSNAFLAVTDQDEAKRFYTEVLGFRAETEYAAPGFRWLSLVSPDEDGGVELVLGHADEAMRAVMDRRRAEGMPAFSFTLRDAAEFEQVRRRGATVVTELTPQEYGGTDGLVDDGVGNLLCLHLD